ncbi:MAG: hypothetical protein IJS31_04770 [Oscillospiraceae bacterium]|nr:hypothetical protein [Oscillospiraceae bacterium]
MDWKTCFFIGHRDAPESIGSKLLETVERHITDYDVSEFVVGHYGRFDSMAAAAVRTLKKTYPNIRLLLLLPYYPTSVAEQDISGYDATFFPPGMERIPKPYAIIRANEYMIQNSAFLICYNTNTVRNTQRLVKFALTRARKRLIQVTNIAERC